MDTNHPHRETQSATVETVTLYQEAVNLRKYRKPYVATLIACAALATLAAFSRYSEAAWELFALAFGLFGGMAGFVVWGAQQEARVRALGNVEDIKLLPVLAQALEFDEVNTRRAVCKALVHLLPLVRSAKQTILNADQRAYLRRELNP